MRITLRHTFLILFEIVLFVAVIASILAGALLWRLQQGPLTVDFVKPMLAQRAKDRDPTIDLQIGKVQLTWPDWTEPLVLDVDNLVLKQNGETRLALDDAAMSIARLPLLYGQIQPVAAIFRQPQLKIIRTEDDSFEVMSNDAMPDDSAAAPKGERFNLGGLVATLRGFALAEDSNESFWNGFLQEFEAVRVENASFMVEDQAEGVTWALPDVTLEFAREYGRMEALLVSKNADGNLMAVTFSADPVGEDQLNVSANVKDLVLVPPIRDALAASLGTGASFNAAPLDAKLDMTVNNKGEISVAKGSVLLPGANVAIPGSIPQPLEISDVGAVFDYKNEGEGNARRGHFNVSELKATLNGIALVISSNMTIEGDVMGGPVTIKSPEIDIKALQGILPQSLEGRSIYDWLGKRITAGTVKDLALTLDVAGVETDTLMLDEDNEDWWLDTDIPIGPAWQWAGGNGKGSFTYSGLDCKYLSTLPAITGASGTGTYDNETLTIAVAKGQIGDMAVANGEVKIDQIETDGAGMAYITVPVKGPLVSLIDYVSNPPISLDPALLGDTTLIKGVMDIAVKVSFPTLHDLPKEQVEVDASGTATGVTWPDVTQGLPLNNGNLKVNLADSTVVIDGTGQLDKNDASFKWSRSISDAPKDGNKSTLKAKVATDDALRLKLGFPLDKEVKGPAPMDVDYVEKKNGPARMKLAADLTATTLYVDVLGYTKPPGIQASGTGELVMAGGNTLSSIENLNLKLPDGSLTNGTLRFNPGKDGPNLAGGTLSNVKLPRHDFQLVFTRPKPDLYDMAITAKLFDATPILSPPPQTAEQAAAKAASQGTPFRYKIGLSSAALQTAQKDGLTAATVMVQTESDGAVSALDLKGNTAGGGNVYVRFKPEAGSTSQLFIDASDAGAMLRAFGIYENVVGGRLVVSGVPYDGNTMAHMKGQAALENFTVVKAPGLARLLNAMSLTGMGSLLNGKGITFKKLQTNFTWADGPTGKYILIADGRTSGASLGLTFDGNLNRESKEMDITGTIIPVSEVNKLISKIPLVRDILLGGKSGSLIAATYKMSGPTEDPKVSINPLSVLTPGIIRKILFEQDKDKASEPPKTAAPPSNNNSN
jgi:hypothetical protein